MDVIFVLELLVPVMILAAAGTLLANRFQRA